MRMLIARSFLSHLREKWREVPTNDRRVFSAELLQMDEAACLDVWRENDATPARRWYREHYGPHVREKDVLDLGCGFSTDGIYFARQGARVTFADIVQDNLGATRRVAEHFGLMAEYYYVDNVKRFKLPHAYDFIFAIGSLHHCPFRLAQKEVRALSTFLRPGGLFLLFTYPKERYNLSGAKNFHEFGQKTDGERTPWAEWYDDEKIRALFGSGFDLRWSKTFGQGDEPDFNWFEVAKR
jgi:SAM-dependent methyltransferase